MNIFLDSLCTAFLIIGMYAACNFEGMIFFNPCRYLERKLPIWIVKPLFYCPICMSSFWSLFYCLVKWHVDQNILIQIPLTAGIVIFLSHGVSLILAHNIPVEQKGKLDAGNIFDIEVKSSN